jgi:hypothetical protein
MSKIQAENSSGKFRRKIEAENLGRKFLLKILAGNLGGKFRCITKFVRVCRIHAGVYRIHAPGKNSSVR